MRTVQLGALAALPLVTAGGLLLARTLAIEPSEAERVREQIAAASEIGWLSVSRDGRHFAFAHESGEPGVFLAGTGAAASPRRLPIAELMPRRPVLSPDGRHVAYQAMRAGDSEALSFSVYVHDTRSGTTSILVDPAGEHDFIRDVSWSPDGRELTYTRIWRDAGPVWQTDLRAVAVTGGDRRLYRVPDHAARSPSWSPDGARVAFLLGHQLAVMNADGTEVRQLTAFGEGEPAPSAYLPDAPSWSPDGTRLAYSVATGDCHRIWIVEVGSGEAAPLGDADECAMRPVWSPDGEEIVYIRLGGSQRTLWRRALDGGSPWRVGFADGMTYEYAFDAGGDLLVLGMPSDLPRSVVRIPGGAGAPEIVASSLEPPLPRRWISRPEPTTVVSSDGLAIPIQVFPRTCGAGGPPGPGVVWLHGGPIADVSARWYQEIQYLTALGATVVAVNYRGSTGNGRAFRDRHGDRDGQVQDTLAAIAYAADREDVDPDQLYLLPISFSTALAYPAYERTERPIRGIIDWTGAVGPIRRSLDALGERPLPPILFINGLHDRITEDRRALAAEAAARGGLVRTVEVPESHIFYLRDSRARALRAVGRFLRETSRYRCE